MNKKATFSKNINKDVVLCQTTNRIVSNRTTNLLLQSSVPFTKSEKHIPFFLRGHFHGASTLCIISTSRTKYTEARKVLAGLEKRDLKRLYLNVI